MQHSPSVQTVFKKLERNEPFTIHEKNSYSNKEQALIRGIQLRDKTDKETAKDTYIEYLNKGKRATKSLSSSVRRYIKSQYPKHGKTGGQITDLKKNDKKSKVKRENKTGVKTYLNNRDNKIKNENTYMRVRKASYKYPNASLAELRHGINSKWSQEYRVNHGLNRNYK